LDLTFASPVDREYEIIDWDSRARKCMTIVMNLASPYVVDPDALNTFEPPIIEVSHSKKPGISPPLLCIPSRRRVIAGLEPKVHAACGVLRHLLDKTDANELVSDVLASHRIAQAASRLCKDRTFENNFERGKSLTISGRTKASLPISVIRPRV